MSAKQDNSSDFPSVRTATESSLNSATCTIDPSCLMPNSAAQQLRGCWSGLWTCLQGPPRILSTVVRILVTPKKQGAARQHRSLLILRRFGRMCAFVAQAEDAASGKPVPASNTQVRNSTTNRCTVDAYAIYFVGTFWSRLYQILSGAHVFWEWYVWRRCSIV